MLFKKKRKGMALGITMFISVIIFSFVSLTLSYSLTHTSQARILREEINLELATTQVIEKVISNEITTNKINTSSIYESALYKDPNHATRTFSIFVSKKYVYLTQPAVAIVVGIGFDFNNPTSIFEERRSIYGMAVLTASSSTASYYADYTLSTMTFSNFYIYESGGNLFTYGPVQLTGA